MAESSHTTTQMLCSDGAQSTSPNAAFDELTLVLKLGYRGKDFSGFAAQDGQRTVAGELRGALELLLHREVELVCAGRTDAGVHAIGQYVSLPATFTELNQGHDRFCRSLAALLPDDISLKEAYLADPGFSARFDAERRRYRYRIAVGPRPVLAYDYAWWHAGSLDLATMQEAAPLLLGEHDFKSFCKAVSAKDKNTVRTLEQLTICELTEAGEKLVVFDVVGNAFLHSMVRTIVGTLVEVGRARRSALWVQEVLRACDRRAAGPCAPAKGLTFVDVDYPQASLKEWL